MALTLYYHPLSSYCQKVLIALYENDTPFTAKLVNLRDPEERAGLARLWPLAKFPVLVDGDAVVPESSIIVEYLDGKYPGATRFIPSDPETARLVRLRDRFFDLHVNDVMGKIVVDRLRPEGQGDALGVEQARGKLSVALGMANEFMASNVWACGSDFTMADCAAAPALFYAARIVAGFESEYPGVAAYLDRLLKRPSFARCVREAEPYLDMFPGLKR